MHNYLVVMSETERCLSLMVRVLATARCTSIRCCLCVVSRRVTSRLQVCTQIFIEEQELDHELDIVQRIKVFVCICKAYKHVFLYMQWILPKLNPERAWSKISAVSNFFIKTPSVHILRFGSAHEYYRPVEYDRRVEIHPRCSLTVHLGVNMFRQTRTG